MSVATNFWRVFRYLDIWVIFGCFSQRKRESERERERERGREREAKSTKEKKEEEREPKIIIIKTERENDREKQRRNIEHALQVTQHDIIIEQQQHKNCICYH